MDRLIEIYLPKIILWLGYIIMGIAIAIGLYILVMYYIFIFTEVGFWEYISGFGFSDFTFFFMYWIEYVICIVAYVLGRWLIHAGDRMDIFSIN